MKHKGERHIPDFSHKAKPTHAVNVDAKTAAPAPRTPTPQPKPRMTSAKSGRRGQ